MASLNKVIIIGHIGRDPEVKYTPSGQAVANFSVATDESYTGKDGQKVEKTEWHRIVAWGKTAEFCGNYLAKGRLVYVEGKIETRKWIDKDGAEKYTTEIKADRVMGMDKKPEGQPESRPQSQPESRGRKEYDADDMGEAPF